MVIVAAGPSSISLDCSSLYVGASHWVRSLYDCRSVPQLTNVSFGCKSSPFGARYLHWLSTGHNQCSTKVSVAADYSDSAPNSSSYVSNKGYHPLEEIKPTRTRETELTSAEIAQTIVEVNDKALLVLPGMVHSEPYEQTSWAEFRYIVDDFGDLFFEIFDHENILHDRGASNPVNALIGIDIPTYQARRVGAERELEGSIMFEDILVDDDYYEIVDAEMSDIQEDWKTTDTSSWVHPLHFAKCITKSIDAEFNKKMDHPSNGLSVFGCLRPAFVDEESYLRRLFFEASDGYILDWNDTEMSSFNSEPEEHNCTSTIYRMEIIQIELFSMYGVQSAVDLEDFLDAEPDVLVHSTSAILDHFFERGQRCSNALKAMCKKKGIYVERANLVGVDSLGMDVRVSSGCQVQTHRFPFKSRANSAVAAEKQIQQLLFPRSRRKKFSNLNDQLRDQY
ncbi:unnamed protein product [Rhodiola kirilowii]